MVEEQQLVDSGGLVLAVQTSGSSIRQEEEQDASKIYLLTWAFVAWKIEEDRFE